MKATFYKLNLLLITFIAYCTLACTEKADPRVAIDISYKDLGDGKIQFNNSTSNANTFFWDFSDGTTSTEKTPIHTYKNSGVYNVFFRAKNDSDEKTQSLGLSITKDTLLLTKNIEFNLQSAWLPGTGPLMSRMYYFIGDITYNINASSFKNETPYYQFQSQDISGPQLDNFRSRFKELSLQFKNFENSNTKLTRYVDNRGGQTIKAVALSNPFIIIIQREDKLLLRLNTDPSNGFEFKSFKVLKIQATEITINRVEDFLSVENFDLEKFINQTPKNQKDVIDFNSRLQLQGPGNRPVKLFSWFYQDNF